MTYKRDHDKSGLNKSHIDAALKEFWSYRAENAPTNKEVMSHLQEEMRFAEAIQRNQQESQMQ